jgi:predicted GNAT family N-acyltransferase
VLDAQTHAVRFYERRGFTPEGPPFLDCGIPHQAMRRRLA